MKSSRAKGAGGWRGGPYEKASGHEQGKTAVFDCNSSIEVEINGNQYRQTIDPFEKRNTFEASRLFQAILEEEVRGITRMAVIKSQLETNGAYNGQKIIDIVEYAHRQEELYENMRREGV